MQDLLKNFRIAHESLVRGNEALQNYLCIRFVSVGSTDQIHRDIGINEDQL